MTLDKLRPFTSRLLPPFVQTARRIGLSPNTVSLLAFAAAVSAGLAYVAGGSSVRWYWAGAGLVLVNGWLDLLDGAIARELAVESSAGDLIDHVLDRYADIAIVGGLAIGAGEALLGFAAITGVLMTSYLGTQSMAVGLDRAYGGVIGRADRLAVIGFTTAVFPLFAGIYGGLTLIGWLLVFLAVVGHITALQRFFGALSRLG